MEKIAISVQYIEVLHNYIVVCKICIICIIFGEYVQSRY